jgi:hypothetical protein
MSKRSLVSPIGITLTIATFGFLATIAWSAPAPNSLLK